MAVKEEKKKSSKIRTSVGECTAAEDDDRAATVPPDDISAALEAAIDEGIAASEFHCPLPKILSVAYQGGTIDRCKERCSGDCNQIKETKAWTKLPALTETEVQSESKQVQAMAQAMGLRGRMWMSQGLFFDEVYDFLQELSILDTATSAAAKKAAGDSSTLTSGQCPNAGWANRFLQTGKSDHETKTQGCFGGGDVEPVGGVMMGNLHVKPAVEMLMGIRGDHGCQTKARLICGTGRPVQPHELYEAIEGIEVQSHWCPITPILVEL